MLLRSLFGYLLIAAVSCADIVTCSSAPWQTSHTNVLDEKNWGDLSPTVFAPGGRLYSVERTIKAASSVEDGSSNLVVAISFRNVLVVVSTSPVSPHLHTLTFSKESGISEAINTTQEWTSSLWLDDSSIDTYTTGTGCPFPCFSGVLFATGGNAVDASILLRLIQNTAESMHEVNDGGQGLSIPWISSASLARRVADSVQVATQTVGQRPGKMLASSALITGLRERRRLDSLDNAFSIWRLDPTGQFWDCDAAAIGRGAVSAESILLRLVAAKGDLAGEKNEAEKQTVTNEHIRECLSNMSSARALSVACQCIVETLKIPKDEGKDDTWKHMKAVVLKLDEEAKVSDFKVDVWSGQDLFENYVQSRGKDSSPSQ